MLSGKSLFLTGPPGAGKTYILNEFIRRSSRQGKHVAVTASTGIAATHIGGITIHTWSGLGIRDSITPHDRDVLTSNAVLLHRYVHADALIIDEVSMLHGRRLDMVNEACKFMRGNDSPFGGLQIILVGDLFQLPPVSRSNEPADFIYGSSAWQELAPAVCYLSEQHRQSADALLDVLEAIRKDEIEDWHVEALRGRLNQPVDTTMPITRLYAHNVDVDGINNRYLKELPGKSVSFTMQANGPTRHTDSLMRSVLAPEELVLKVGAEVMFVANDFVAGFVNGTRGEVVAFQDGLPIVKLLTGGKEIRVEPHSWTVQEDGKKQAEVKQLPLRLAWAITIHKSQGMSLDAAEIDLGKTFTPGMGYVALSRVRSLDGVFLTGLNAMAMRLHPAVFEFDVVLREASASLAADTPDAEDEALDSKQAADVPVEPNTALLRELKAWRLRRARADGVSSYIIAHDSLLEALSTEMPTTQRQLLAVPGIGMRKLELYGGELLTILKKYAKVVPA